MLALICDLDTPAALSAVFLFFIAFLELSLGTSFDFLEAGTNLSDFIETLFIASKVFSLGVDFLPKLVLDNLLCFPEAFVLVAVFCVCFFTFTTGFVLVDGTLPCPAPSPCPLDFLPV